MGFKSVFFLVGFSFLCAKTCSLTAPWGKDCDLQSNCSTKKSSLTVNPFLSMIWIHQNFFSPTTAPQSSFFPSSSQYMKLSIQRYGTLQGFFMGMDRLMRENGEHWIYPTIKRDSILIKYDPALMHKSDPEAYLLKQKSL